MTKLGHPFTTPHASALLDAVQGVSDALDAAKAAGLIIPPMVAPAVASLAATTAILYGQESEPGTLDAAHGPALAQAALTALGGAPVPSPVPPAFLRAVPNTESE